MTRNNIVTMRSLQLQIMNARPGDKWALQRKLLDFITENREGASAFRDCLDAGEEKLARKARAA